MKKFREPKLNIIHALGTAGIGSTICMCQITGLTLKQGSFCGYYVDHHGIEINSKTNTLIYPGER
jgi:hypothetical protein